MSNPSVDLQSDQSLLSVAVYDMKIMGGHVLRKAGISYRLPCLPRPDAFYISKVFLDANSFDCRLWTLTRICLVRVAVHQ
jgi:hypothetical protein